MKPKYQHKKVSDLINIGGLSEEDDGVEIQIQNAEYNLNLQDQIIQERAAFEEESQMSESIEQTNIQVNIKNDKRKKVVSKCQTQTKNHHLLPKTKITVIDLGIDHDEIPVNKFGHKDSKIKYDSMKTSHEKNRKKPFAISETKAHHDSRNIHIIKSASNNEISSNNIRNGLFVFDPNMMAATSQREFMVDDSNDQSYTILQAASISAQKGKERAEFNCLHTMCGQESNLTSNHKLCYLNSGVSGQSLS